jgi:hypothetical protein
VALVRARAVTVTKPIAATAMTGAIQQSTKRSSGRNDRGGDGDGNGHSDGDSEGNGKRRKQRQQRRRKIEDSNKDSKPGMHLEAETSPLPWHSVSVAMTVRRNRNNKKYTAQPPPVLPIIQLFCCSRRRLL